MTTASITIAGCVTNDPDRPETSGAIADYEWNLLEKRPNAIPHQERETDTIVFQVEDKTAPPQLRINGLVLAGSSSCRHIDLQELAVQEETLNYTILADYEDFPQNIPFLEVGCTQDIFWEYYELRVSFKEILPKTITVTHLQERPPNGTPKFRTSFQKTVSI
jgi:hypothetical protein